MQAMWGPIPIRLIGKALIAVVLIVLTLLSWSDPAWREFFGLIFL